MKSSHLGIFTLITTAFICLQATGLNISEPVHMPDTIPIPASYSATPASRGSFFAGSLPYDEALPSNIYVSAIKNTDDIDKKFMLDCISDNKTPYIIIEPYRNIFDTKYIKNIAETIGYYNIEAIIELYPIYDTPNFNIDAYKSFYADAQSIFAQYAPDSKLVWAISSDLVYEEVQYFPGKTGANYIGISLICGLNGKTDNLYPEDELEYLHYTYELPIFITRFALTDYSEKNHAYYKNEKAQYIKALKNITKDFTFIEGLILYQNNEYIYEGYKNKLNYSDADPFIEIFGSLLTARTK